MRVYELIVRFSYDYCRKGFIWCVDGSFVSPSKFKKSAKTAYGYVLSNGIVARLRRSTETYTWDVAKFQCAYCNNAGKYGYFPNIDELKSLQSSIMSGKMKEDLMTAGIYEECNYRKDGFHSSQLPISLKGNGL